MYKANADPIKTNIRLEEPSIPVLTFDLLLEFAPVETFILPILFGTNFHFPVKFTSLLLTTLLSLSYPSNTQVPSFTLTSNLEGFVGETLVPFSIPSWFFGRRSKISFGRDLPGVDDSNLWVTLYLFSADEDFL